MIQNRGRPPSPSFVVMKELRLKRALKGHRRFVEAGFEILS